MCDLKQQSSLHACAECEEKSRRFAKEGDVHIANGLHQRAKQAYRVADSVLRTCDHARPSFVLSEIKRAMAQLDDISRTLIVHPTHEAMAREAIHGQPGWNVRVSDHHPDPNKVWIMASPYEVRERIGGFS